MSQPEPAVASAGRLFAYPRLTRHHRSPALCRSCQVFTCLTKHLQAQGVLAPGVLVALAANVLNVFLNWLCIYSMGLGIRGAPIATSLARWFQCLSLLGCNRHLQPPPVATSCNSCNCLL